MCSALALFSQSLLLQLMEGYFWQSLSCPFPSTLALTAAVIVSALSKYLGRVWRNQTSEPCTQVACNSSLFKCNYLSSVVFLCFALWCCQEWCIYWVQSKVPLWGSDSSQPEMADIMVDCFPPSIPSCISWCFLSSCCLSLLYSKLLYWETSSFKKHYCTIHCSLLSDHGFHYWRTTKHSPWV